MTDRSPLSDDAARAIAGRSIVLVGMMGAGKTSVGKRLAARLGLPFVDADAEIEAGARMTISEIFEKFGEPYFRDGERRVIARLLEEGPSVLSTGGGAFMNELTRARIAERGVSIWLKPDFEVLLRRVRKRSNRPLLQTADPEATMRRLLEERSPTYALADITIDSHDGPHEIVVEQILGELIAHARESRDRAGGSHSRGRRRARRPLLQDPHRRGAHRQRRRAYRRTEAAGAGGDRHRRERRGALAGAAAGEPGLRRDSSLRSSSARRARRRRAMPNSPASRTR